MEENKCLPNASFILGLNADTYEDFHWSRSSNIDDDQFLSNDDSLIIYLVGIEDAAVYEVYLDIMVSENTICKDTVLIQAVIPSNLYPEESNTYPANASDSIKIDFTPAGNQCSIFNFWPQKYNNDTLKDSYIHQWEIKDSLENTLTSSRKNDPLFFLELEGTYDLYVKVIKPISCGNEFLFKDSLIRDFVTINGNIEIQSELNYLCLDPEAKYPIFIDDFSPIPDTTDAEESWSIYRKSYDLEGNGATGYSPINNSVAEKTYSTKDSTFYQFNEAGDYLVLYNINIPGNCTYSDMHTFNIGVQPQFIYPRSEEGAANFTFFPDLCSSSNVYFSFKSTSYLDVSTNAKYNWFTPSEDVIIDSPDQKNPDIAFQNEGEFELTLQVENYYGCIDSVSHQIRIENAKPNDQTVNLTSSVLNNQSIELKIDSMLIDYGFYYQLDRWDDYFYWVEDYGRFNSSSFIDENVSVSSNNYLYRVTYHDYCGNDGSISNIGSNILLEGTSSSNHHLLTWGPYQEWAYGVESYQVQLLNQKTNEFKIIDEVPSNDVSMSFNKEVLIQDGIESEYCYRIQANLVNSSEISISNTKCFTAELINYFPNAFTPNGDHLNDVFKYEGLFAKEIKAEIYNRWGNLVYSSDEVEFEWDGKNESTGEVCPQGTYIFQYELTGYDGTIIKDDMIIYLLK
ncbi:MAG: gliding motility-associated C-terminal domain-containing protein [Gammaproteobacteria bacterium]|nr:gliding motility-associated C-terminal domain-containing protein [Gammaproteobacteria bacterium]